MDNRDYKAMNAKDSKVVELKSITNPKVGDRVFSIKHGLCEIAERWECFNLCDIFDCNGDKQVSENTYLFDTSNITENTEEVVIKFKIK